MKKTTLSILTFLICFVAIAQTSNSEFSLYNPTFSSAPATYPGGTETIQYSFTVATSQFTFSSDQNSNNHASVTFSFTKLNPTGITPSGTGANLFTWTLSSTGTGVGQSFTYTGESKDVTMLKVPGNVYFISFVNVPVTNAATQSETDIRVNGQFTAPTAATSDQTSNNTAFIATYSTVGGPLPISLLDFTATKQSKVVDLNWQTSTEQNSNYFDVEFSRDGSKFESIGRVNAAGTSTTVKDYSLVHLSPINGINYYRLKLVDVDGSFRYSAVRTVKFSSSSSIVIMPNPTTDKVFITSNEGGVLQVVALYSVNGKLLQQVNNFAIGKSIDLSTYAPSVYLLKLIDKNGGTEVLKIVKK